MDSHVISFRTLRRLIGVLGILLPWACWAANALVNNLDLLNNKKLAILSGTNPYMPLGNLKSSISHFYYTASAPLFIGIIVTVAIFLFCYKGYDYQKDRDKTPWLFIPGNLSLHSTLFLWQEEQITLHRKGSLTF